MEVLSSSGHSQIVILGAWFASRYVESGLLDGSPGKTLWRSSKSDRALESGYDFVKGYNDTAGSQVIAMDLLRVLFSFIASFRQCCVPDDLK